jgi:hypothetical protein
MLPYALKRMSFEAVIRRREGYSYGLEFVHVTASDQKAIDFTCDALSLLK